MYPDARRKVVRLLAEIDATAGSSFRRRHSNDGNQRETTRAIPAGQPHLIPLPLVVDTGGNGLMIRRSQVRALPAPPRTCNSAATRCTPDGRRKVVWLLAEVDATDQSPRSQRSRPTSERAERLAKHGLIGSSAGVGSFSRRSLDVSDPGQWRSRSTRFRVARESSPKRNRPRRRICGRRFEPARAAVRSAVVSSLIAALDPLIRASLPRADC